MTFRAGGGTFSLATAVVLENLDSLSSLMEASSAIVDEPEAEFLTRLEKRRCMVVMLGAAGVVHSVQDWPVYMHTNEQTECRIR